MNTDALTNPLIKAAIEAMNAGDRQGWFALFAPNAVLTDDGNLHNFTEWSNSELFGKSRGYVTAVERIEDNGLAVYAQFHSDQWGDFKTFMKFAVAGGKITRLDVGQA